MIGALLPVLVGNLLAAAGLAGIACAVHRSGRDPRLAHLLWLVVLLKLMTPPLLTIPSDAPAAVLSPLVDPSIASQADAGAAGVLGHVIGPRLAETIHGLGEPAGLALLVVWVIGSLVVLGVSLVRVRYFERLLAQAARPAPEGLREAGRLAALRLGLGSLPSIEVVDARLTPMTWWTGGRVRVLIPDGLADALDPDQLRSIVAHELAHVKRRDHLVRWLEWIVGTIFWWNPLVWWTRRCLRADEEAACDALVLRRTAARPRPYAEALLEAAVYLSGMAQPSLALATGVGAHGPLEQRLRAILARRFERSGSRRVVITATSLSLVVASLGLQATPGTGDVTAARVDPGAGWLRAAAIDAARPGEAGPSEGADDPTATETFMMLSGALDAGWRPSMTRPSRSATDGRDATTRQLRRSLQRVERALAEARRSVRVALQQGDRDAVAGERTLVRIFKARAARLEARLERETGFEPATASLEGWRSTN